VKLVYTDEQIDRARTLTPAVADKMSYQVQGTPEPGEGIRDLSAGEIHTLLQNPKFRRAVEIMERIEGHEKGVRAITRAACSRIQRLDKQVMENAKAIELNKRKQEGRI